MWNTSCDDDGVAVDTAHRTHTEHTHARNEHPQYICNVSNFSINRFRFRVFRLLDGAAHANIGRESRCAKIYFLRFSIRSTYVSGMSVQTYRKYMESLFVAPPTTSGWHCERNDVRFVLCMCLCVCAMRLFYSCVRPDRTESTNEKSQSKMRLAFCNVFRVVLQPDNDVAFASPHVLSPPCIWKFRCFLLWKILYILSHRLLALRNSAFGNARFNGGKLAPSAPHHPIRSPNDGRNIVFMFIHYSFSSLRIR